MVSQSAFDPLLRKSVVEFFRGNRLELSETTEADLVLEHAAVIGFSGAEVRGVLGIGMGNATLERIARSVSTCSSNPGGDDWLGEASNQLLGRFKNKLYREGGVAVSMALPMVLRGLQVHFVWGSTAARSLHTFGTPAGRISVWLDLLTQESLRLSTPVEVDCGPLEGEMLVF